MLFVKHTFANCSVAVHECLVSDCSTQYTVGVRTLFGSTQTSRYIWMCVPSILSDYSREMLNGLTGCVRVLRVCDIS